MEQFTPTAVADAPVQSTPATDKRAGKKIKLAVLLLVAAAIGGAFYLSMDGGSSETTEDAYVEGNIVQVTPQLAGSVTMIAADNTDFVQAGQVLVKLNDVDARLALERAEAQLARTVRQVRVQFSNASQSQANVRLRASELAKVQANLDRRRQLVASGAVSGEDVQHAEDAVKAARAALAMATQQMAGSRALVDQTSVATHPDVQAAVAQLRDAYLAHARTTLRAPVSGIVGKRNVQLGQRINAGAPLMSVVPTDQLWVNANFKESQLRHIRIGQPVILHADVYGKSVTYNGRVVGQDAGTGNAFSLLPAQNASGNWIKVVQRVPVRIALDPKQLAAHPLKLGLSMTAEVATADQSGPVAMDKVSTRASYRTDIFSREMEQAEQRVQRVIAANVGSANLAGIN